MWCVRHEMLALARVPLAARALSVSAPLAKKSLPARGKTRKSPNTLLRLYEQGKLEGAEAARAAALLAESDAAKPVGKKSTEEDGGSMSLHDAFRVIRAVDAARPQNAYELHIVTSVPSNQTNAFRGRIVYPKEPRIKGDVVLVFAEQSTDAEAAARRAAEQLRTAGSSAKLVIGGHELINDAASNRVPHFTRVLCTVAMLPALSKALARTLGPKGLMPSVKRGTAVEDGEEMQRAVEQLVAGVDWRGDRAGVVRGAVGRLFFTEQDLRGNVEALLDAVITRAVSGLAGVKTSSQVIQSHARDTQEVDGTGKLVAKRGTGSLKRAMGVVKQAHLSSTQGPGIRLRLEDVL